MPITANLGDLEARLSELVARAEAGEDIIMRISSSLAAIARSRG